jgi:hypothetical protein
MKSDICFWKWGFEKVFWNFISEVSFHIYCLGNGISVDVLTGDSFGKFSCHTYNGPSTVDYVIVSKPLLFEIPLFNIANFISKKGEV